MLYDLHDVPFSTSGSYLVVAHLEGVDEYSDSVWLRTIRGSAATRNLLTIDAVRGGELLETAGNFTPELLRLQCAGGGLGLEFTTPRRIRITGDDVGIRLRGTAASPYDTLVRVSAREWRYLRYSASTTLVIQVVQGAVHVDAPWDGLRNVQVVLTIDPDPATGRCVVEIEETLDEPVPAARGDGAVLAGGFSYREWLSLCPEVPPHLVDARELAAYVMWSSLVAPSGHVERPTMYMSKNWMVNVWSWDHCFNALALERDPDTARDQFMTIFDHQSRRGALPDSFNDGTRTYTFTKPPIHGWALARMMDKGMVSEDWQREAYEPLAAWTRWWLTDRVAPGRRLPHYFHGNDSGWDNSTLFASSVPLETADLAGFLVLQMDALARIAEGIGDPAGAQAWRARADELLEVLIEELWQEDHFVARDAVTGQSVDSQSLLLVIPIVLGERLPRAVYDALVLRVRNGDFLTEHGLATEATSSADYESDGYWRGPIWAPSTFLVVDGLRAGGEFELARRISQGFCDMVAGSGMAENFDAVSGAGLRDRAYSWTASVFLVLASEILGNAPHSGNSHA